MTSLLGLLKAGIASLLVAAYLALSYLAYKGLEDRGLVSLVRHVVLVTGLVPLLCWLGVLVTSRSTGKLLLLAVGVTILHVVVFAVSAHVDGLSYWALQLIEIVALVALAIMIRG